MSENIERMPPQAVDIERAVLGAILINSKSIDLIMSEMTAGAFYFRPHGKIYTAMMALADRGVPIDQMTLSEELKRRGQLDEAGGVVYLSEVASTVVSSVNIKHHASIVVEKAMSRGLIEASAEIGHRAYEARTDVDELLDWSEQRILSVRSARRTGSGAVLLESVLVDTFESIERAHNNEKYVTGVTSGFADMDEITAGFQDSDLIILAARPSVGKTALSLCLAKHAAQAGSPGLYFSLEMSKKQVSERLLSIETHVDLHRMRTGRLRPDDWLQLTRNVGRLAQLPIYIDDTAGQSIMEVRAQARALHRQYGIRFIIVDYLQLMTCGDAKINREQEVSRISRGLKALAKELSVPVLALSQLSRAVEGRPDKRPQLSDLRDSGDIEQSADVVMFIYRPDMYGLKSQDGASLNGTADIIIAKQRNGPTGSVHLMWNKESASFDNLAPEFRVEQEREHGVREDDQWPLI